MFVQIIEGRASDAEGLNRHVETWRADVMPGAIGFLGVTSGVTADGRAISMVRFESAEAAQANSDRPEQGAWWAEMEKYYDGEVTFTASTDITMWRRGGTDDAGFVQIMKFAEADRELFERMDAQIESVDARPDVIGGYRAWTGPSSCVEVVYFTSEVEARAGEQAGLPEELADIAGDLSTMTASAEFYDLTDPVIF